MIPTPTNLHTHLHSKSAAEELHAISEFCSLHSLTTDNYGDFHFGEPPTTSFLRQFEAKLARKFDTEDGLFCVSGVMAQNIVMCISVKNPPDKSNFVCHNSSHLIIHEQHAYKHLLGIDATIINNGDEAICYDDVVRAVDEHTGCVIVEVPQRENGAKFTPFSELQLISKFCKDKGITFHLDGARLWEIMPAFEDEGHSYADVVGLFDR